MKLESLKSSKFSKNALSKASLALLHGGGTVPTANGADSNTYFCCGDLYDCTEKHEFETVTYKQEKMFENTKPEDYLPDQQ